MMILLSDFLFYNYNIAFFSLKNKAFFWKSAGIDPNIGHVFPVKRQFFPAGRLLMVVLLVKVSCRKINSLMKPGLSLYPPLFLAGANRNPITSLLVCWIDQARVQEKGTGSLLVKRQATLFLLPWFYRGIRVNPF
jgi:hypothetical protein